MPTNHTTLAMSEHEPESRELSFVSRERGPAHDHDHDHDHEDMLQNGRSLPPTDRGRGAYVSLACCTVAQVPIWGQLRPSFRRENGD